MQISVHRIPGLVLIDHEFAVPLDYGDPSGKHITLFAREIVAPDKERETLPWLLFLQGGPGYGGPRPDGSSGWIKRALQDHRVLLLDQRGTGRSTPVLAQTLARQPSPAAQADMLRHFRADAIVQDAERIRRQLAGEDVPWSALGQSFGGFCLLHYLCAAPEGLREALFTGGLPPIDRTADEVYRATYRRVIEKNHRYYERYPDDAARAATIADFLAKEDVRLPRGGRLTVRRFQQLGMPFGVSDGFERIHYILEEAFVPGAEGPELGYSFLEAVEAVHVFDAKPIYAILHEAIYCQRKASRWAAERVRAEYPQFDPAKRDPLYFTGEMIYPWMFDDYVQLRPLKETAEILANWDGWPPMYDRETLGRNSVPCAAVIYHDDMYVERTFSEETARTIPHMRVWITNEYEHNGLRADGEKILDRLFAMVQGKV